MESQFLRCSIHLSASSRLRHKKSAKQPSLIQSAIVRQSQANTAEKTSNSNIVYNDSWFERLAIKHLSRSVQNTTGLSNNKSGYASLVEGAAMTSRKFDSFQQQELVLKTLEKAIPRLILVMIRILLPNSKLKRELFATFTTIFFKWLVGPSEVRESEFNDHRERNVVHINKCRFLEQSNCVGMCINLCKMPTQTFIKDSLGMPINMVPNFDDMSCEMIFGQDPPPPTEDPVLKQSCYKQCKHHWAEKNKNTPQNAPAAQLMQQGFANENKIRTRNVFLNFYLVCEYSSWRMESTKNGAQVQDDLR